MVRVKYERHSTQASALKHLQTGHGLQVNHMAYGAGLGGRYLRAALHGGANGAMQAGVKSLFTPHSGSYRDQIIAGAVRGAADGLVRGKGLPKKAKKKSKPKKPKRPF